MARFAASRIAILPQLGHALAKLSFVRIGVTQRAGAVLPVINGHRFRLGGPIIGHFVTVVARHRDVASRQQEPCLLVAHKREGRRSPAYKRVAGFAAVQPRSGSELSPVLIGVAVEAFAELYFVERVSAFRDVALCAIDRRVLALERIG